VNEWWGGFSEWLTGTSDMRQWEWGSTADWVTGLLTAFAVLIAAQAFRHDRQQHAQSHARLLLIDSRLDRSSDPWTHVVVLDSRTDLPFTECKILYDLSRADRKVIRQTWKKLLVLLRAEFRERYDDKTIGFFRALHLYYQVHRRTPRYGMDKVGTLDANDKYELDLPIGQGVKLLAVVFRDSSGQMWGWDVRSRKFMSKRRTAKINLHANELSIGSPVVDLLA
jgi:hypothetical protein